MTDQIIQFMRCVIVVGVMIFLMLVALAGCSNLPSPRGYQHYSPIVFTKQEPPLELQHLQYTEQTVPVSRLLSTSHTEQTTDWNSLLSTSLAAAGIVFMVLGAAGDTGE